MLKTPAKKKKERLDCYPAKIRKFLEKYYEEYGVGKTVAQRLAHWNTKLGPMSYSHNPTDAAKLAMCEIGYLLAGEFPGYFPTC